MSVFVRSEQSWILLCTSTMVIFFINLFQGSGVERICCDSESSANAEEKHRQMVEKYGVSYFSIVCDDFLLHMYMIRKHNRLISTPGPRTGFMKNSTITNMHQRTQLRSDLTNPICEVV